MSIIGSGSVLDNGTGFVGGSVLAVGANDWRFVGDGRNGSVGIDPNFALANTDRIGFSVTYER